MFVSFIDSIIFYKIKIGSVIFNSVCLCVLCEQLFFTQFCKTSLKETRGQIIGKGSWLPFNKVLCLQVLPRANDVILRKTFVECIFWYFLGSLICFSSAVSNTVNQCYMTLFQFCITEFFLCCLDLEGSLW